MATVYSYDSATTDQKEISYSDGTPTLRYSYDRMGRAVTIEDATGTRTMEYCTCGKLAKEHLSADFFGGRKLEYKLSWAEGSVLGRTIGYTLSSGGTIEQDITFGHDGLSGRLETITTASTFAAAGHVFRYAYLANSSIVQSLSVDGGNNPFSVTRSFETNRDVLTSIETKWSTTSRARFEYTVDKLGQRSSKVRSGDVYADYWDGSHNSLLDTFAYDSKGQLTAANTYRGGSVDANKVFHDRQHAYSYDNIGNRNYSSSRTSDAGLRDNYNVLGDSNNSTEVAARDRKMKLNQIHTRENNLLNVSGTAHLDAKVEVSGRNVLAARQGRYWNDALTVGNVLRPWRGPLTIFAAQQNGGPGGTTDLVRTDVRLARLPQALQTFEYDDDGNLTTDGVWDYLWDAENRIVRMTTTALAVQGGYPNHRLEFKYDYLGRRVLKRVSDQGTNQLVSAVRLVYEGWNMIGEYTDTGATLPGAIKRSYTWGLDIVHTREKAGGVGALLQIADYVGGKGYFPAYDGNGNVVALFDGAPSGGSAGTRVAAYEYSPFGELLRSEGGYAADNPVRFSTKVTDDESGLVYYGRRYYSPNQGRFLGRDPIEEGGGVNLYGFVSNNPIAFWDYLGTTGQSPSITKMDPFIVDGVYLSVGAMPLDSLVFTFYEGQDLEELSLNFKDLCYQAAQAAYESRLEANRDTLRINVEAAYKNMNDARDWRVASKQYEALIFGIAATAIGNAAGALAVRFALLQRVEQLNMTLAAIDAGIRARGTTTTLMAAYESAQSVRTLINVARPIVAGISETFTQAGLDAAFGRDVSLDGVSAGMGLSLLDKALGGFGVDAVFDIGKDIYTIPRDMPADLAEHLEGSIHTSKMYMHQQNVKASEALYKDNQECAKK